MAPLGTLEYDEAVDIFAEQAAALVAGGVDLLWVETMSDLLRSGPPSKAFGASRRPCRSSPR